MVSTPAACLQGRASVPGGCTDIAAVLVQGSQRSTSQLCMLLSPGLAEVNGVACPHCPERRDGGRCLSNSRGESRERSRSWGFGDRQRHRCLQPECRREGHLTSVGPDGTAHGSPLARDMSTEAAPKVTARLGRSFTELLLPLQLLGFGRLVDLQTTSCSPLVRGGLPGDLPEDSAHQPLPWDGWPACFGQKKNQKQNKA